jgi:hypothetical protein
MALSTTSTHGAQSAVLGVGDVMPDVTLVDLEGRPRRLAETRGRPVLIFMWASW